MTGIMTGAGLGLFNSSANVLGGAGLLGQGLMGQAKQRSYVNVATGNLILQSLDEMLSGRGDDLIQQRTYNSLGQLDDGDGDGWRWDGERTVTFNPGDPKQAPGAGGSITRTDAEGHQTTYTWDGTKYVSTDGDGAHDTIRFESSTADGPQWVWTDGTSRQEDRYDATTGRLASQTDLSGNVIELGYTDGRLTSIKDHGSGQWIELVYDKVPNTSLIRLKQVNTHELVNDGTGRATATVGAAIDRVDYSYDSQGRLTAVKTDLTPDNTTDDSVYVTAYGYDGDSSRIASVSQSDGTVVRFTYKQASADGPWRIDTVTDASGVQTFGYDDANRTTSVSFDAGNGVQQLWKYVYDADGQLTQIQAPGADGTPLITTFEYETEQDGAGHTGNLKRVIDARGNATTYGYDALGNRTLERDAEGDTITRTYNDKNQLLTETRYTVRDPDGDGAAQPAGALTKRFVYDDATHTRLLFVITPEGRVTQSVYGTGANDAGLLTKTIHFTANNFDVTKLSATQVPSEADMTSWLSSDVDKKQIELSQLEYDRRGNISRRVDYAATTANGDGVLADDKAATVTDFIYDAQGLLRQTIAVRGRNRDQSTTLTSYDFDGLGRETKRVTAGATQSTSYDGSARTVTTTNEATGLVETRTYDDAGRLTSVSQSGNASGAADGPTITRQSRYVYDLMGRQRMSQDVQGNRHFYFYNDAGQLQFTVDSTGAVCKYEYDPNGQLIAETHFADTVSVSAMSDWVGADGMVQKTTLVVGTDFDLTPGQDRATSFLYDKAGRLVQRIDAANVASTMIYDGASRIKLRQTVDRVTRYLYDRDGLQVGVVDPMGYLTETRRDAAGRPVETIRYTHRSTAAVDESAPLWVGVQNQTVTAYQTFSYRLPAIDADGDELQFSIVGQKPDWLNFDPKTATLSGVPPMVPREFTVVVRADDQRGKTTDVPVTFTVTTAAPVWAQLRDVTVPLNTPNYELDLPLADNPQHTPLTYSLANPQLLPEGLSFSVVNGVPRITGTPTKAGSAVVTLQVTDGQLVTQRTFTLSVISRGPMWLLDSRTTPVPEAFVNTAYHFTVPPAIDPDGQALVYSPIELPAGLSFNPDTREITGTPATLADSQLVRLQARDADGNVTELRFGINVRKPNLPPTWDNTVLSVTRSIGVLFDYTPPGAKDPEGKPLRFFADNLPAGLSINPATGRITGTPTQFANNQAVTLTIVDSGGLTATCTLFLTIQNQAPIVFNDIPDQQEESPFFDTSRIHPPPAPYSYTFPSEAFKDPDGQTLTYSARIVDSWFTWLDFDPKTRTFSGSIPVNETHNHVTQIEVTATDPYGQSVTDTFQLTITKTERVIDQEAQTPGDASVDESPPPEVGADPVPAASLPPFSISVPQSAGVGEGDRGPIFQATANRDVNWTLGGTDADKFTIDGNGFLRFIDFPDFDGQRDYSIKVEARTSGDPPFLNASQNVSISVGNRPPQIFGAPDEIAFDEGTLTTMTLFTVGAADPGGGFASFDVSGDTSAFTIDGAGNVKFAQVPDFETKNRYVLTFHSADSFGASTTKNVVIDIRNLPPTIFGVPASSIEVDEGMDPSTNLFPVSALDAGGGSVTLTLAGADAGAFQIVDGQVRLRQTPDFETKSVYNFVVHAEDAAHGVTEQAVTVKVRNIAPTLSGVPVMPIEVNEGFNGTLFTAQPFDPPSSTNSGGQQVDGLTFSLTGADAAAFTIDPISGQVRFRTVPDFETQKSYAFTVRLTDGGGAFVEQSVSVKVKDLPPMFFGGPTASVPEGTSTSQWVYFARATDGGGNLSYSLEGPDADALTIDSLGRVFLKQVPNYETKNSYSFTVRASDGTTQVTQPVTLSVTNLAPTLSGPDSVDVQEETAGVIFAPIADDAGGGPIFFTLEGPDAGLFSIDRVTGEVRFRVAPDFDARTTFSFSVRVSDGTLSVVKPVSVHVTDLPAEDDLSTWRPTDTEALHSYMFYDGKGQLVGSLDDRGFLTETVYDDEAGQQQSISYLNNVTFSAGDTLDDLRKDAIANNGKSEIATTDFDTFGRLSKVTAVDGTTTRNVYDLGGRLVQQIVAEGQFEADGVTSAQRSSRTRYNAFGEVTGSLSGTGDAALLRAHPNPTQADIDDALKTGGTRYEYNDIGERVRSIDANGNVTRFFYDGEGRLTHTVNARGEVIEIHYNAFGQADATRLYKTPIDPSQLTGGSNVALQGLLKADDSLDRVSRSEYDPRGLLTRSIDALGFETDDSYTAYGELFRQERTIQQAKDGKPGITTTTRYDYDLDGRLISTTGDEGGVNLNTQTGFDAYGRVIRSVDGAGRVTTTSYEDGGRTIVTKQVVDGQTRTQSDTYDAFSRVAVHIDALGNPTRYEFDDANRKVTVTTPEGVKISTVRTRSGEVFTVTDGRQSAADPSKATIRYTYDENGNVLTVRDALGQLTQVNTYDDSGRLHTTADARGTLTLFSYDELNRVVKRQVDPTGLNITTLYEFDSFGEKMTVTEALGTAAQRVTSYAYDQDGRLQQMVVDPNGLKLATTYKYNGLGNTIQVSQGTQDNPDQQVTIYEFDGLGRRTAEIEAPSSIFGPGTSATRDLTTSYFYDDAGNVSRRVDADGNSTWFVYNEAGELTDTIAASGALVHRDYDLKGRVIRERRYRDPLNTRYFGNVVTSVTPSPTSADQRSYFAYDKDDNQRFVVQAFVANIWLVSETRVDANRNVIESRRYDLGLSDAFITSNDTAASPGLTVDEIAQGLTALGYKEQELGSQATDAASLAKVERTRYAYDKNNQLRFAVDAMGGVTESVRNAAGDVTSTVRYAVRPALSDYSEAAISAAVNRQDPNNRVTYFARDAAGRLRFVSQQVDAATANSETSAVVTEYVYDDLDHVVETILYSSSTHKSIDYTDASKVPDALLPNNQDRISASAFDRAGREVYRMQASEVTTSRAGNKYIITKRDYDDVDDVVRTTAFATAVPLADFSKATLDLAVSGLADDPDNRVTSFVYDKARRLHFTVAPDGSFTENVLDGIGQVLEQRQFDFRLSPATPRTEDALIAARGSRAVGDGMTRGERYTYDLQGHVIATTDAAGNEERSLYDVFGNRVSFIDKNGVALLEQHANDVPPFDLETVTWSYFYDLQGRLIDEYAPKTQMQLSNASAPTAIRLRTHYTRDAFGNVRAKLEALDTVDMRMTQYEYDNLNQQTLVRLPGYYDPTTGRVESTFAAGRVVRTLATTYDAFGDAVRTALVTGAGPNDVQYEYKTYDVLGRVVHNIDALGDVTYFLYNNFNEQSSVVQFSRRLTPVAPNGLWTAADVGNALGGNPLKADPQARRVDTVFDNLGRKSTVTLQSVADPDQITADNAAGVTRYDYNAFGDVIHEAIKVNNAGTGDFNGPGTWRNTFHYFDSMSHEILTVDPLGYQTRREFDANGNLVKLTEFATAGDRAVIGSRTPPPAAQTSADDRATTFFYDTLNRQIKVQRLGLRYIGAGGDNAQQTATTVSQTTYDHVGRVIAQTDAMGNVTTHEFDMLGWLTKMTEPARETAGTSLDPFPGLVTVSPVTTYTLNAFGQVVTQIRDPAGGAGGTLITLNGYDYGGNLISTTDANHASFDGSGNIVADHTFDKVRRYDYAGRVIEESQAIDVQLGNWQHVSQTLKHRYAYDAAGHQIASLDVYDGGTQQSGRRSVFNAFGEVSDQLRVWGAAGSSWGGTTKDVDALAGHATETSYQFDNAGRLDTQTAADGVTKFFYNLAGQVTRQEQRGATVRVTETDYDDRGNAITQRQPGFDAAFEQGDSMQLHTAITPFITQQFDRWGNVISRTVGGYLEQGQAHTELQATTTYRYNHDNQVIEEIDPVTVAGRDDGTFYNARVTHQMGYDLLGRLVQERDIADDVDTQVDEATVLRTRTREYNSVGMLTAETDAEGHTTSYAYDAYGNRVATKNAHGTVFVDTFDKTGHMLVHGILRLSTEADGAPYLSGGATPPVLRELNRYLYDQAGRRMGSTEVLDSITFARLTDANTFTQLDERGLVRAVLNPNGILTQYQYNQFGLKTLEQVGSDPGNLQTWTYSDRDYSVGRMDTATAGTNTTHYFYNTFGQVEREEYSAADNVRRYTYYDNGLLARIDDTLKTGTKGGADLRYYNAIESTSYKYDVKGQVVEEHFERNGEEDQMVNDPSLRPLPTWVIRTVPLEQIIRTTFTRYDARGRVTRVWAPRGPAGAPLNNGLTVSSIDYNYDELGNVRHISAPDNGTDLWFTYDREGRMTIADGERTADGITEGTKGTKITYNELGLRSGTEVFQGHNGNPVQDGVPTDEWDEFRLEKYTYDDLDHLRLIEQKIDFRNGTSDGNPDDALDGETDWFKQEERLRVDIRGSVLERQTYSRIFAGFAQTVLAPSQQFHTESFYREDGRVMNQTTFKIGDNTYFDGLEGYTYRDDGLLNSYQHQMGRPDSTQVKDTFQYHYGVEIGGVKEESIDVTREGGSQDTKPGSTVDAYDVRGRLKKVVFSGDQQKQTTRTFAYNAAGQAILVEEKIDAPDQAEQTGTQALFFTNGRQVGTVGTGTLQGSHFSFAYTPITDASTPDAYTVRSGDSLASIAQAVYGDPSLWYLIADANSIGGLGPNDLLPPTEQGRVYRIPTLVRSHNNADTFKPYNPADVIGNTTPSVGTAPPPCIDTTRVLAVVVSIAVQVIATALLSELGPLGAGIGAAAGDLTRQGILWAGGEQKGINFDEVNLSLTETTFTSGLTYGADTAADVGGSELSDRLAQQAISTAVDIGIHANDPDFDLGSSFFKGAVRFVGAAAGPDLQKTNWDLGGLFSDLANDAFNPQTGWVFNENARNWTNVVSQVAGAFTSVAVNAGVGSIRDSIAEDRLRDRQLADLSAKIEGANYQLSTGSVDQAYNRSLWNGQTGAGASAAVPEVDAISGADVATKLSLREWLDSTGDSGDSTPVSAKGRGAPPAAVTAANELAPPQGFKWYEGAYSEDNKRYAHWYMDGDGNRVAIGFTLNSSGKWDQDDTWSYIPAGQSLPTLNYYTSIGEWGPLPKDESIEVVGADPARLQREAKEQEDSDRHVRLLKLQGYINEHGASRGFIDDQLSAHGDDAFLAQYGYNYSWWHPKRTVQSGLDAITAFDTQWRAAHPDASAKHDPSNWNFPTINYGAINLLLQAYNNAVGSFGGASFEGATSIFTDDLNTIVAAGNIGGALNDAAVARGQALEARDAQQQVMEQQIAENNAARVTSENVRVVTANEVEHVPTPGPLDLTPTGSVEVNQEGVPADLYAGAGGGRTLTPSERMVNQELEMSCGAACARQLLLDKGIDVPESQLRDLAKFEVEYGTQAPNVAAALNAIDPKGKWQGGGVDPDAFDQLNAQGPWIARLKPDTGPHFVIVDGVQDGNVLTRDPWGVNGPGTGVGAEGTIPLDTFKADWTRAIHQAVFGRRRR